MVVAFLTDGLQVKLVEFGLLRHLRVANGTREMIHAPRLVQSGEHVARYHRVAVETHVAE